jgi:GGDEF domain-containing protein
MHITGGNVYSYRLGGDEFAALILNGKESDIDVILAKWRKELERLNSADDGIHCSISAGAAFGAEGYDHNEVLKLADERMYANKVEIKAAKGQKPR